MKGWPRRDDYDTRGDYILVMVALVGVIVAEVTLVVLGVWFGTR